MYKTEHEILALIKDQNSILKEQQEFNIRPKHDVDTEYETIIFGMGCFWGADCLFGATKGVLRTTVGYSGGTTTSPKYRNLADHTEVIKIDFDPKVISFNDLLDLFWNNHEYGLSSKIKRQYMSVIFYSTEYQKEISINSKMNEGIRRKPEIINTEIREATTFYPAEDYHQKYRLQEHNELSESLKITTTDRLHNSYVAAKLNGYLVGINGEYFLNDKEDLGLTSTQKEYIRYFVEKNKGRGLFC